MNSVERVKAICKERKIPISKLERDLGYANGYIGQLRKGVFPDDRLSEIAKYLSVSTEYLITGEQKEKAAIDVVDDDLKEYLDEHYTEKISLEELSRRFFINKYYILKLYYQ